MDIMLDETGDLRLTPAGDILLENSVSQKIRIRLLWFEGEWRWNVTEGMPYFTHLLVKNPDIDYFESSVRKKIFEVDEVVEVKDVRIDFDRRTRDAVIHYVAITDHETIKEEVRIKCLSSE